jgi:hypothetical protein
MLPICPLKPDWDELSHFVRRFYLDKQHSSARIVAIRKLSTSSVTGLPRDWPLFGSSRNLLATNLRLLPRRLQLSISLCLDLLLPPRQHVLRGDVADGAIQANVVVVRDEGPFPAP